MRFFLSEYLFALIKWFVSPYYSDTAQQNFSIIKFMAEVQLVRGYMHFMPATRGIQKLQVLLHRKASLSGRDLRPARVYLSPSERYKAPYLSFFVSINSLSWCCQWFPFVVELLVC